MRERFLEYDDKPYVERFDSASWKLFRVLSDSESEVNDREMAAHILCNSREISSYEAKMMAESLEG